MDLGGGDFPAEFGKLGEEGLEEGAEGWKTGADDADAGFDDRPYQGVNGVVYEDELEGVNGSERNGDLTCRVDWAGCGSDQENNSCNT